LIGRIIRGAVLVTVTILMTGIFGEVMLRIKNSDQKNYTIEIWRYSNELKEISSNPKFGHVQVPNSASELQGIDITINSLGMRGPELHLDAPGRKILLLGSSITLGWGVSEEQTIRAQLERNLGQGHQVLNGGVGNYNTDRSVAYFKENWRETVKPDTVVVHYFVNDAEYLPPSESNFFLRHSQLAVMIYYIAQGLVKGSHDLAAVTEHYRSVYRPDSKGFVAMKAALDDLKEMADADGFKVVFSMVPDIHQLEAYPFDFIHDTMRDLVKEYGWEFLDFQDNLNGYEGPELWTIPGDPHPNALAHRIMAEQLAPYLK
jgi:hypothetical protein